MDAVATQEAAQVIQPTEEVEKPDIQPQTPKEWLDEIAETSYGQVKVAVQLETTIKILQGRAFWRIKNYRLYDLRYDEKTFTSFIGRPEVGKSLDTCEKYMGLFRDFCLVKVAAKLGKSVYDLEAEMTQWAAAGEPALAGRWEALLRYEALIDEELEAVIEEIGDIPYSKLDRIRQVIRDPQLPAKERKAWIHKARAVSRSGLKKELDGRDGKPKHAYEEEFGGVKRNLGYAEVAFGNEQWGEAREHLLKATEMLEHLYGVASTFAEAAAREEAQGEETGGPKTDDVYITEGESQS